LNGESFQPWALKIGASRNARHDTAAPRSAASVSKRIAAGYE
jgi:hypothetical protein